MVSGHFQHGARGYSAPLTCRFQAGTANEETVDIGLLGELTAVLLADGATVDDPGAVGSLGRDGVTEPLADGSVHLLSLLSGSDLAGSDSPGGGLVIFIPNQQSQVGGVCIPDGLVGDDNLSPLFLGELLGSGVELPGHDLDGLVGITLL